MSRYYVCGREAASLERFQANPIRRAIDKDSYWVPRRLYARALSGDVTADEVGDATLVVLSVRREWVLLERCSDEAKCRLRPDLLRMDYVELEGL